MYRKPKSLKILILTYVTTDLFVKKAQKDYGNGFLKHKRLEQHWKLSDRISILEIQMKPQYGCTQNGKAKITIIKKEEKYTSTLKGTKLKILKTPGQYLLKIVNLYARHSEITNKNLKITINFYNNLNNLLNQINNKPSIVLVAGDFNRETANKPDIDKLFREFLWRKKKRKWTTPHNFMHESRLINKKHVFQTQRKKINTMGTNLHCTR